MELSLKLDIWALAFLMFYAKSIAQLSFHYTMWSNQGSKSKVLHQTPWCGHHRTHDHSHITREGIRQPWTAFSATLSLIITDICRGWCFQTPLRDNFILAPLYGILRCKWLKFASKMTCLAMLRIKKIKNKQRNWKLLQFPIPRNRMNLLVPVVKSNREGTRTSFQTPPNR